MVYSNNFIVVIKHKGKILRDINRVVRLPFGSEYSILLKNKDSRTAVANIEIDGEDVMGGHQYIVPGNSSRELKGFLKGLEATHKFRFIKKTKEISEFRGDRIDDGIVRVEFKYEQIVCNPTPWVINYPTLPTYPRCPMYGNGGRLSDSSNGTGDLDVKTTFTSSMDGQIQQAFKFSNNVSCNYVSAPKLDEGITVKGTKANQNFQYGNVGILESQSHVIVIRLKGALKRKGRMKKIKRPVLTKTRVQCQVCGRKWKSHLKFCGNCSAALD